MKWWSRQGNGRSTHVGVVQMKPLPTGVREPSSLLKHQKYTGRSCAKSDGTVNQYKALRCNYLSPNSRRRDLLFTRGFILLTFIPSAHPALSRDCGYNLKPGRAAHLRLDRHARERRSGGFSEIGRSRVESEATNALGKFARIVSTRPVAR